MTRLSAGLECGSRTRPRLWSAPPIGCSAANATIPRRCLRGRYLRLFALAAGGALLAEEALAALRLAGNGADAAGRIAIARFFAENLAVGAESLERTVVEAADSVNDADAALV